MASIPTNVNGRNELPAELQAELIYPGGWRTYWNFARTMRVGWR
jgi:hypothetical protein